MRPSPTPGALRRQGAATQVLLVVGLLLLVSGCTAPVDDLAARVGAGATGYRRGVVPPVPYVVPAVTLTDTSGRAYDLAASPARPVTLLFFGYTSCEDVCPGVLADLALALRRLPAADRDKITTVFVTTDPERDDPARIRAHLDRFDRDFVGLTGTGADLLTAAHAVGVQVEGRRERPHGGYALGHSAHVVGVDGDGHGVVLWNPGVPVADLAHDLGVLVARTA